MAAPSGTIWGSIVKGSSNPDGRQGKIGIYINVTNTDTQTTVNIQGWFATKYGVQDGSNSIYYDVGTGISAATTSRGSLSINHTVSTGAGWSTSNQTKLFDVTNTYNRGTSAVTYKVYAKFNNIDILPGSMLANTSFTVPKLASYTISYNANGGSGAPSSQTKYYGKNITLSSTKPTRMGYSFQGWATSASGSVAYAAGASYTANAGATLYAVWKANTYTVSYNANGGTGAPGNQTKTYGTTLKLSSTKPTRTNYNFLGWATSASATTATYAAGANYTANAAVTLYAVWDLAYVKPRITNLSVYRTNGDGLSLDSGTCVRVKLEYECDRELDSINIAWSTSSGENGSVTAAGDDLYSGSVDVVISENGLEDMIDETGSNIVSYSFSTEKTYTFSVTVSDDEGYSVSLATLNGTKFTIDLLDGGNGAAFGKPAELDGVLDIGFKTRHFGGLFPVVLEPETDLNNVLVPNTYTGDNISNYNYVNCPVSSGTFTLLVESCGEDGQVKQTYTCCSKYKPERYSRFYYQGSWGAWFWANTDEYILYENDSGSNGTITLAAALSHFRYIEVYFTDNNGKSGGYTKVYNPNGKTIPLQITEPAATVYSRQTHYVLSGTTMTPDITNASYFRITSAGAVSTSFGTNYIKVVRVIGRA